MGSMNIYNGTNKASITYTGTSDKTIDANDLVSGTNIKTINSTSLLGSGDIAVPQLSGLTAYHLLEGSLALASTTPTSGFSTTLYTGNGSTQSINTGVDMSTQWGNDVSEQFGGLVWVKSRSLVYGNYLYDTVRGATNRVRTDTTDASAVLTAGLTAFNTNGFSVGNDAAHNTTSATQASWNFQTTHRITGTTNHGKSYTCHYNPFTGFTIVKYEGSGIAGHEIPHHLGRKLGFAVTKTLTSVNDWFAAYKENSGFNLNLTNAEGSGTTLISAFTDSYTAVGTGSVVNTSGTQYILYGWANSYFDESNKLIGNYLTTIDNNGILRLSVHTNTSQSQIMWQMSKPTLTTGDWDIVDYTRGNTKELNANLANAESTITANSLVTTASPATYPRATDTSNLQVQNAIIPFANGIDANGSKITTLSKNETFSGVTWSAGKNYPYYNNTGARGTSKFDFGATGKGYNGFGDYYDLSTNKWYSGISVFSDDFSSDTSGSYTTSRCSISILDGYMKAVVTDTSDVDVSVSRLINVVAGRKYKYVVTVSNSNTTGIYIRTSQGEATVASTVSGARELIFTASSSTITIRVTANESGAGQIFTFDNIAVYPIKEDGTPDLANATEISESRNYMNHIVYADNDGSPLYVEELPKVEYKDIIKANEYRGKNACTAWVNFDGTTTPPTIRDSYNVSSVVRTATGVYDVYFTNPIDNTNYSTTTAVGLSGLAYDGICSIGSKSQSKQQIYTGDGAGFKNASVVDIQIFGGRN